MIVRGGRKIRVLVVDDSAFVREMIVSVLSEEPDIVVVGEGADGREAVRLAEELQPDIITLDIEMPVMGGLEAIEAIIARRPVPILVVTALTGVRTAFSAVSRGALDVIEKPDITPETLEKLKRKIRILAGVDVAAHLRARGKSVAAPTRRDAPPYGRAEIVAVAASTGGPQALHSILSHLPGHFAAPIVVTQHIAEGFTQAMVDWLGAATPLKVSVARHGDLLAPGRVYVNPAEKSMIVTEGGMILLGDKSPRQLYTPCCDTLLLSVAQAWRERAVGVILSGMGDDGVAGMQAIRRKGGATLAQDAKSSVIYGMNRTAVEKGCIDRILPLADIPAELIRRSGLT